MKYKKTLLTLFFLSCAALALLVGCGHSEKGLVKKSVTKELDLLKEMDRTTALNYISYQDLFPNDTDSHSIPDEILDIFPLFFKDFSYKVMTITIDKETNTADALVRIETIDAKALAKDYMKATMKKRIASSANPQNVEYSLEDYYLLLAEMLQNNTYNKVENNCHIKLINSNSTWKIEHNEELDNQLVGGFVTYIADASLFTPEEIVAIHFDTIKEFDTEQLNRYLLIDSLFDVDDAYNRSITQALTTQIHNHFDYEVTSEKDDGHTASVTADITSCDFKSIVNKYEKDLQAYLSTSKALADGTSGRLTTANKILLSSIESNTSSSTTTLTLKLVNDGSSWKLQMDEDVAQAILGGIGEAIAEISSDVK